MITDGFVSGERGSREAARQTNGARYGAVCAIDGGFARRSARVLGVTESRNADIDRVERGTDLSWIDVRSCT
jgi:hypothetical protein